VSTIAHLPAAACTTSAPGSKSPLGRGGGATHHALGVLPVFPVVSVRLCEIRRCQARPRPTAADAAAGRRRRRPRAAPRPHALNNHGIATQPGWSCADPKHGAWEGHMPAAEELVVLVQETITLCEVPAGWAQGGGEPLCGVRAGARPRVLVVER